MFSMFHLAETTEAGLRADQLMWHIKNSRLFFLAVAKNMKPTQLTEKRNWTSRCSGQYLLIIHEELTIIYYKNP